MIKDDLSFLKTDDIYSLSMFMLYKLVDEPQYAALSELPYILNRENMLSLCEYFGGRTIKIPTIDELYSIMNLLLVYQYVKIDHKEFSDAIILAGYKNKDTKKLYEAYSKLSKVLDKYEFKVRK